MKNAKLQIVMTGKEITLELPLAEANQLVESICNCKSVWYRASGHSASVGSLTLKVSEVIAMAVAP